MNRIRANAIALAVGIALVAGAPAARAGEKKLMHCFAFTVVSGASQSDWNDFFKKTDALPSKIPGVTKVWYGKLARPLDAGGSERQWGVCMEMNDEAALKAYGSHPYHAEWMAAYGKVRVPGTTTFNILGQ